MQKVFEGIKGVIFDMDGTLLDSMSVWHGTAAKLLGEQGIKPSHDLEETLKPMSLEEVAQYLIKDLGIKLSPKEIIDGINAQVVKAYAEKVTLKPGVKETLEYLKNKGIKMCVATATPKFIADSTFKRLGVFDYFDTVMSCDEIGEGKTSATIYLAAAEALTLSKDEVVVVEDALHCIETLRAANIKAIGVYDESAKEDNAQIRAISDVYLDGVGQMERII